MRGEAFAAAMLCAALGLALSFVSPRLRNLAILVLVLAAGAVVWVDLPPSWVEPVWLTCWAALILVTACVFFRHGPPARLVPLIAVMTGTCAGAMASLAANPLALGTALPWVLLTFPAGWLVRRGHPIALRVLGSWLIAISVISAVLPLTPTPGYLPDHME